MPGPWVKGNKSILPIFLIEIFNFYFRMFFNFWKVVFLYLFHFTRALSILFWLNLNLFEFLLYIYISILCDYTEYFCIFVTLCTSQKLRSIIAHTVNCLAAAFSYILYTFPRHPENDRAGPAILILYTVCSIIKMSYIFPCHLCIFEFKSKIMCELLINYN